MTDTTMETTKTAADTAEETTKFEAVDGGKAYTMRPLQSRDLFAMSTIISKIGFKQLKAAFSADDVQDMIAGLATEGKSAEAVENVGIEVLFNVVGIIIENLPKVEGDVYKLLSSLSGMDFEEIASLPIATFGNMIADVVLSPDFRDFIKVASRFAK